MSLTACGRRFASQLYALWVLGAAPTDRLRPKSAMLIALSPGMHRFDTCYFLENKLASPREDYQEANSPIVVKFNYPYRVAYVRFIGTHAEYDEINVEEV